MARHRSPRCSAPISSPMRHTTAGNGTRRSTMTAGTAPEPGVSPASAQDRVRGGLAGFTVEVPSWAFGNSGTRFKVFSQPGVPRDPFEKIADAAQVHRYTGVAPRVSLHIPWDKVADFGELAKHAADLGVTIGAINSNLFQDDDYMLGSLTHPDESVRRKAIAHHVECVEIMR